jgi:hypothetical protein
MELGRTSCTGFWANQFRVWMTAAAYVLMQELRLGVPFISLVISGGVVLSCSRARYRAVSSDCDYPPKLAGARAARVAIPENQCGCAYGDAMISSG